MCWTARRIVTAAVLVTALSTMVGVFGAGPVNASPGGNGPLVVTGPGSRGQSQSYVVDPSSGALQRVFAGQVESNYSPVWSPDGEWLAFNRFRQLLVARADGSETRLLDSEAVYKATWSPDGTQLAYTLRPNGRTGQIWVINADGTDRHMIHEGPSVEYPAWSPLGDRIAFSQRAPVGPGGYSSDTDTEVFVMDVDGGNVAQLTSNTDTESPSRSYDTAPTWSPDGSRLAFVSGRDAVCPSNVPTCEGELYLMNADGAGVVRLAGPGSEGSPSWSPDGSSIAYAALSFSGTGAGTPVVHIRDLNTGAVRDVTQLGTLLATVDWGAAPGSMAQADLSTGVTAGSELRAVGGSESYSATVRNDGAGTAEDAVVTFRLPPGATYDGSGPAGCAGTVLVRCALGDVPAGALQSVTIGAAGSVVGVHEVSAMATSTTADPDFNDNRSAVQVAVCTELGTGKDDTIRGTGGDDVLCGAGGDDTLKGRGGNDLLLGGSGGDVLDGGKGKDAVSFAMSRERVVVDLTARQADGEGADRLTALENAAGSPFSDVMTGSAGKNTLDGAGGRDRLSGLGGADRLLGGAGADVLAPGVGNDLLDGGLADDLVDYADSPVRVRADLGRGRATAQGTDTLASVEGVRGSPMADELVGSVLGNRILGGGGDDDVSGAGGNDRVMGGAGADELLGGDGDDRFSGGAGVDRCAQDYGRGKRSQCERK